MPHTLWFSYASQTPQRLDCVLAAMFPSLSRTKLSKYCTHLSLNDISIKFSHKLRYGDSIKALIEIPATPSSECLAYQAPLDVGFARRIQESVRYSDETLLVLNKQRGDVVHIGAGHYSATIAQAVFPMLQSYRKGDMSAGRAGIVHRLDKDTSGILLVARTAAAHDFYAKQFACRAVKKTYLSILKGTPPLAHAEVTSYIARHVKNRKKFCNYTHASQGKEARSHYTVLNSNGKYSLVQWNILTGRTHQIRLHAQHIGSPVLGDALYARAVHDDALRNVPLMLHAWKLEIALYNAHAMHAVERSKGKKEFCAPMPQDMQEVCAHLFDDTLP